MKYITTIKGPSKAYKTAMLILVANEERKKGHVVKYAGEEVASSLYARGLDQGVFVKILTDPDDKNRFGRVTSVHTNAGPASTHIWRVRQSRRDAR